MEHITPNKSGNGNKSSTEKLSDKAAETVRNVSEKAENVAEKAKQQADEYVDVAKKYVNENPIKSLITATAIGIVIGAIVAK